MFTSIRNQVPPQRLKQIAEHFFFNYAKERNIPAQNVASLQSQLYSDRSFTQNQQSVSDLFNIMDTDKDGEITLRDCQNLIKKYINSSSHQQPQQRPTNYQTSNRVTQISQPLRMSYQSSRSSMVRNYEYELSTSRTFSSSEVEREALRRFRQSARLGKVSKEQAERIVQQTLKRTVLVKGLAELDESQFKLLIESQI